MMQKNTRKIGDGKRVINFLKPHKKWVLADSFVIALSQVCAALIPTLKGLDLDTSNAQLKGIKEYLEKKTPAKQQPPQKQGNGPNNNKTSATKPAATVPKSVNTGANTSAKR